MPNSYLPKWAPPPHLRCLSCKGLNQTEWCSLAAEELSVIDQGKVSRRYKAGESVYQQGEACRGIYCIEQGTVAVRTTRADGSAKMLRIADAGQTLGYADFFSARATGLAPSCWKTPRSATFLRIVSATY